MRYISINLAKEGMTVARTLFNEQGVALINTNSKLTISIIKKLEFLGYKGLVIEDEIDSVK